MLGYIRNDFHKLSCGSTFSLFISFFLLVVINIHTMGGSRALVIAAVWTGVVHLAFSILGTFILKRFPTSFAIGFLLGLVLVLANQNLVLGGTFYSYRYGVPATNQAYGSFAFILFFVLTLFGGLLFQFKKHVIVAPIDAKGAGFRRNAVAGTVPTRPTPSSTLEATSPYQSYDKDSEASDL